MRGRFAACAFVVALSALPAFAHTIPANIIPDQADDYARYCRNPANTKTCTEQMLDRMWALHWVRIFNPDQEGVTFCGPSVNGPDANTKIVADVVAWIDSHPEHASQNTQDVEDAALLSLFPCSVPYAPFAK